MAGQIVNETAWTAWEYIDEFLKKERDSFFSSVTHIQLGFAAVVISSILLSIYSFLSPLVRISEIEGEDLGDQRAIFVFALALTIAAVLAISLYALSRIRRRLIRSLEEELLSKAKAIRSTSERFSLELPPTTLVLLQSIEKL